MAPPGGPLMTNGSNSNSSSSSSSGTTTSVTSTRSVSDITSLLNVESSEDDSKKNRPMYSTMLSRTPSTFSSSPMEAIHWREQITPDERALFRQSIRSIYASQITSRKDLLNIISALQEEYLYAHSNNRISYFKHNISTISKIKQFQEHPESITAAMMSANSALYINNNANGNHNASSNNSNSNSNNSSSNIASNSSSSSESDTNTNTSINNGAHTNSHSHDSILIPSQTDADIASELLALRSAASPPPSSDLHMKATSYA
jgi:hypothetical protein